MAGEARDGRASGGRRIAPDSIELVRLGRDGDRASLNAFLRRYRPRLLRVVGIRMGELLRQRVDPEDIVQEVFMVAVAKLPDFRLEPGSSLMCWLTRISDHVTSNERERLLAQKRDPRRERRLRTVDPPSSAGTPVLRDGRPTPAEALSRRELEQRVDACVEQLEPDSYRQVILLRDYMEADWETIREELERPSTESARELHRRARAKLRERLAQLGLG